MVALDFYYLILDIRNWIVGDHEYISNISNRRNVGPHHLYLDVDSRRIIRF